MEAIDALKQKVLSLAIQGKLVPQDPNDEPASVLLEKIKAEKAELVKQGKIKKDKQESYIFRGDDNKYYEKIGSKTKDITDEIPFEIPDSWEFIRLKNLSDAYTGNSISENIKASKYTNLKEGYNYIGTKDVGFNHVITYENGVKIPFNDASFRYAYKNAILLCIEGGSAGRKVGILSEKVCFGNKLCAFHTFVIPENFLYYLIQSDYFFDLFRENVSGLIGGVSVNKIKELIIPLPPLSEQKRIVSEIESIFKRIDEVKSNQEELARLKDGLKNKILDLAIQGKLVEQDPNDEPASVLLEKIKAEKAELVKQGKIKKDKQESYIFKGDDNRHYEKNGTETKDITEEIPFEIPNSWQWVRLGNVFNIILGQSPDGNSVNDKEGIEFHQGKVFFGSKYLLKSNQYTTNPSKLVQKNTVLLCVRAPVGIVNVTERDICIGRGLAGIANISSISTDFIYYWLQAYKNEFISKATGTTFVSITGDVIQNQLIPLPPLSEQERIISAILKLTRMIEML